MIKNFTTAIPYPKTFCLVVLLVVVLAVISLFIGAGDVSFYSLLHPDTASHTLDLLFISRIPRTVALVLAGIGMSVAGAIMQMMARNRFVDPSTTGTVESATFGILIVTLFMPGVAVATKMIIASCFAIAGSALFMGIMQKMPLRSGLLLPLVGILLGRIINALTMFFAYGYDMIQSLTSWTMGDFSGVLRGRYELLWISFFMTAAAYIYADRFTVAGMGENFTANLGLNYRKVVVLGLVLVSIVTATVVVTAGTIPFLGIIVANVVSLTVGDNMRKVLPWIAVFGATLVLACDIVGRVVRYPYEVPIGTIMGVVGGALFLVLLLRKGNRAE